MTELDYAATLDAAQGLTVEQALPLVRPSMGRSQLYSGATRGRQAPEYFVVTENEDQPPTEILRRTIQTDDLARTASEIAISVELERQSWAGLAETWVDDAAQEQADIITRADDEAYEWSLFSEAKQEVIPVLATEQISSGVEAIRQMTGNLNREMERIDVIDIAQAKQEREQEARAKESKTQPEDIDLGTHYMRMRRP